MTKFYWHAYMVLWGLYCFVGLTRNLVASIVVLAFISILSIYLMKNFIEYKFLKKNYYLNFGLLTLVLMVFFFLDIQGPLSLLVFVIYVFINFNQDRKIRSGNFFGSARKK